MTKAGIVYFPRLETEPNLRMIDFIRPVVQVASGEVWVGPTRGFDLTTRIRLTAIVVRGISVPAGWKETSSASASHDGPKTSVKDYLGTWISPDAMPTAIISRIFA
jgi:hypothetical protein